MGKVYNYINVSNLLALVNLSYSFSCIILLVFVICRNKEEYYHVLLAGENFIELNETEVNQVSFVNKKLIKFFTSFF